ncbi:galactosylceramide sulfotransferase-like isoform X2 [Artemia franciscana]|uniref:Galactosylceramide sulfotransferase-like n=1 Tax=Artemia franciscana TaxID=6661 RepID=A0AA88KZX8_ARTSF|nr:hypothetical protein QYM36_014154 [Artemia franciscana]
MKRNTFLMLLITWVVGFVTVFQWRIQDRAGNEEFSLTDDGRYAHINDLNVILPLRRWNYLGSPELFSLKLVNDTPWHHLGYDIMALHTRWDHSAVKQALGGDPIFVTIIREPVDLFESLYSYYSLYSFFEKTNLYEFLDKLEDEKFKRKNDRFVGKIGRNQMLFDLGFPVKDFGKEDKLKDFVDGVERKFDLVMIKEKMEESIVLLKHLLCWEYKDLVYLKLNSRAQNEKKKLSVNQADKLRKWLKADNYLYMKLRAVFDRKVEQFGYKKMEEEKKKLSSVTKQIMEGCLSGKKKPAGENLIQEMRKSAGCRLFALDEYSFLDEIKIAQWKRADKKELQSVGSR